MSFKSIILAAGKGTRMKSDIPKVMHCVNNHPMIEYVIKNVSKITNNKPIIIVGHKSEYIIDYLGDTAEYVKQEQQLGTGHAVMMAKDLIENEDKVLIICGDTPLITEESIQKMFDLLEDNDGVIMTSYFENPFGYGRIIEKDGCIKIVEEKDASEEERQIKKINAGTYALKGSALLKVLNLIDNNNSQNEYYLTDIFNHIKNVSTIVVPSSEILGINSRKQLALANKLLRERINDKHMENGVTIIDPENTYIDIDVKIGSDSIIYPNCNLRGNTSIGSNCKIYENSTIIDSVIEDDVVIKNSYMIEAYVGKKTTVGPFAYLRPKAKIGENVKIGDFVEVKNANIGNNSKASHLSYIGDADVGENVNIGCGVVFVNYDGKNKFRSIVKDNAFIGSNSNLVAPVIIEDNAYIATGSTVTINIPENSLCIARSRETIKNGWNNK